MKTIEEVIQEYERNSKVFIDISNLLDIFISDKSTFLNDDLSINDNKLASHLKCTFLKNGHDVWIIIQESDYRPTIFAVLPPPIETDELVLNLDEKQTQILKDILSETE